MPEIIEAEITKQKLTLALRGKRILRFDTDWEKGLTSEKKSVRRTARALKGAEVQKLKRYGKIVAIFLEKDKVLAIHQRMSGSVLCNPVDLGFPEKHVHFNFLMDDGTKFGLLDPRKFGTVWYGSKEWFLEQPYVKKLGPDAMKISEEELFSILENNSSSIKSLLLQQDKISGLGNIACDEILWKAGIDPRRKAKTLSREEADKLHTALYEILASVLKHGGTSMSDWRHPDGETGNYQKYFRVYKKDFCRRCRISVNRIKVAGRGTYLCNQCQA